MSNRRRLRTPGRYEPQPHITAVREPVENMRPLVAALAGSIRRQAVAESVLAPEQAATRTAVTEASVGGVKATKPGRMLVRLIKAGISLNGNAYPPHVLREAAQNKAWPKGCQAFCDHMSDEEEAAHPSGSVKNLAGVLTEDARWDEATQSLVAEVRLFEPWRAALTDMAEHIGMSIRAWVSAAPGEYEGREANVVSRIEQGRSVDFVTVPAAGGAIISVLEAVGTPTPVVEAANLGAWLESRLHLALTAYADDMYGDGRLTRDERLTLSAAIGDGLQAWTARVEADAPQLFLRSRWDEPAPAPTTADESAPDPAPTPVTAAGHPAEPAPTSPMVDPLVTDGTPPPASATPTPEEEPVSGTQTGAPPEQAGIAPVPDSGTTPTTPPTQPTSPTPAEPAPQPTGESVTAVVQGMLAEAMRPLMEQLAAANAREAARDAEARTLRNRQTATEAVTAALRAPEFADVVASIGSRVTARVVADVPVTAEGVVDDTRLTEAVTAAITAEAEFVRRERANALAEAGVGLPYGLGGVAQQEAVADDGLDAELNAFFKGSLGMSAEAAAVAAKGRG